MQEKIKVYLAIFLAMMFWGFSFVWTEQVLKIYDPITTILFRLIISVILLVVLNFKLKRVQKIEKKDYKLFILLSFFQPFIYFICENYGLKYVSSTVTSVIIATIPLFSPIAAYFFLHEKVSKMNFFGIIVSIIGVLLVIIEKDLSISANPIGILCLSLAVLSAVFYTIVIVRVSGKYNVFTIITVQNSIGILLFIPLFFIVDFNNFINIGFNFSVFIPIIKLAVFGSTLAYLLFTYTISKLGAIKANTFGNTIPIFTVIFAFIVLGKIPDFVNIIGILVVISGLFLSQITSENLKLIIKYIENNFFLFLYYKCLSLFSIFK